jgi:Domain of unknown function (DUF4340)
MNVRLSFLLVAVLIIFGGTFLVFNFTRAEEDPPQQPWLYKVPDDTIVHIEVTYNGQTGIYNKKPGSNNWFIQEEGKETPVFIEKWSGTPLLLSGPQVQRVLAATIDNPADYGLEPPQTIVKVTERTGLTYEFHMGDTTPDGQNQYARLVGDPKLFTVPQIWAQVINRLATEPPYARIYYVQGDNTLVHIGVVHDGQAVDYERQIGSEEWHILTDSEVPVAEEKWSEILPSLSTAPVAQVVSDKIDEPAKYGLESPQTRVRVTTSQEEPVDFYLGNATPDGQSRYAQRRGTSELFTVPETWAKMLEGLATKPPYPPGNKTAESG